MHILQLTDSQLNIICEILPDCPSRPEGGARAVVDAKLLEVFGGY